MSKLYFVSGTMGSGKSTQLISKDYNYRENGKKTIILKPTTDTRNGVYKHGEFGKTYSRPMKEGADCLFLDVGRFNEVGYDRIKDKDIVFVDEAQFLSKADVDFLASIPDELDIPVLAYGLKTTAEGELFEGSAHLLAMADEIEIMISVCSFCGRRASHHVRISGGEYLTGNAGVEGNGVEYKACCRKCFKAFRELQKAENIFYRVVSEKGIILSVFDRRQEAEDYIKHGNLRDCKIVESKG